MKRTELRRKTPLKRSAMSRGKAPSLRQTPLRKVNPERVARRHKAYNKVLSSDFHKQLRYQAFLRSGGRCECGECKEIRGGRSLYEGPAARVAAAFVPVPVWFTKRGAEPWQRFRSTDGEIHHVSYAMMGQENPDELRLVQWVWKACHERIENEHGTRRKYLSTGK